MSSPEPKRGDCERCGAFGMLYLHKFTDDEGEKQEMWICWDCDFDILNGRGDYSDDPGEVYMDHWENEYAYDPINTPPPPGYH